MKESFSYPISREALEMFCHPVEATGLSRAARWEREILAANGYAAIRVQRGSWLDSEFPAASAEYLGRIGKLPWLAFPGARNGWRSLADVASSLGLRGGIGLWLNDRLAPSPVWLVGGCRVRLSLLQLVARLPRVEVYAEEDRSCPLWFRFSGGLGAIAADPRLWEAGQGVAFSIFQPTMDVLGGGTMKRGSGGTLRLAQPGVNWPPVDESDHEAERMEA